VRKVVRRAIIQHPWSVFGIRSPGSGADNRRGNAASTTIALSHETDNRGYHLMDYRTTKPWESRIKAISPVFLTKSPEFQFQFF